MMSIKRMFLCVVLSNFVFPFLLSQNIPKIISDKQVMNENYLPDFSYTGYSNGEKGEIIRDLYKDTKLKVGSHHWMFPDLPLITQQITITAI